MTHILVTGASGLLGSNVVREAAKVFDVTAVVHEHSLNIDSVEVKQVDLSDAFLTNSLLAAVKPDWVIHCAADTNIDELEAAEEQAARLNAGMTRNVARACAKTGSRLLYVSTDSVFSGEGGPYSESDEPAPKNVYAQSKLDGEQTAVEEVPEALIVRTNLFGMSMREKQSLAEWFLANLEDGVSVPGFVDVFFSPVYAPELGQIFFRMLQEGLTGLYHVPGADCVSKYEFGVRLALKFGLDPDLVLRAESAQIDWQATRPKRTCLKGSKLMEALGIELPDLNDGLAHFRADVDKGLFS